VIKPNQIKLDGDDVCALTKQNQIKLGSQYGDNVSVVNKPYEAWVLEWPNQTIPYNQTKPYQAWRGR